MMKGVVLFFVFFWFSISEAQLFVNTDFVITPTSFEPENSTMENINTTHQKDSPFNLLRSELLGVWGISEMFSVRANALFDAKMEKRIRIDGLYLEGKPDSVFSFRIGKIPTAFGNFVSRRFAYENKLIGFPLMYSYKTPLVGKEVDTNISQLIFRGQNSITEIVSLNEAFWTNGLAVFGSVENFRYSFSLSDGSFSNPIVRRKYGNQLSGRISSTISDNFDVGISSAIGSYLESANLLAQNKKVEDVKQRLYGADMRYEYWRYEFIGELLQSKWDTPLLPQKELSAKGWYGEFRYQYSRTILLTARFERFVNGTIDSLGTPVKWGNDIDRWEVGVRYRYSNMIFKGVWQHTIEVHKSKETLLDIYAVQIVYRWEDVFKAME